MATKTFAKLVDGKTYKYNGKVFEKNVPVEVTSAERKVLAQESYQVKSGDTDNMFTVNKFEFISVDEADVKAGKNGKNSLKDANGTSDEDEAEGEAK